MRRRGEAGAREEERMASALGTVHVWGLLAGVWTKTLLGIQTSKWSDEDPKTDPASSVYGAEPRGN